MNVASELAQSLECVVLALDRDEDLAGRGKGVHGDQSERGRAVDEDVVEVVDDRLDRPPQFEFPAEGRHELDLRTRQCDGGRSNEEVLQRCRLDAVLEGGVPHEDVVHRLFEVAGVDPEARRGVSLGIEVHHENPEPQLGERGTQVDRGGRLADTAFLVGDRDDPGKRIPRTRLCRGSLLGCDGDRLGERIRRSLLPGQRGRWGWGFLLRFGLDGHRWRSEGGGRLRSCRGCRGPDRSLDHRGDRNLLGSGTVPGPPATQVTTGVGDAEGGAGFDVVRLGSPHHSLFL